jgi:Raf kinase inhibitor-like YbhB/YbcL family protein
MLAAVLVVAANSGARSAKPIAVTSAAFHAGARIPKQFAALACGGKNLSPQLSWGKVPGATQSLVVTVYDPDARGGAGFWHWIVYDVPVGTQKLASSADGKALPAGSVTATNGAGTKAYFGPCPPPGAPHHYRFTVYALDAPYVQMKPGRSPDAILGTISSHVLATGSIVGLFGT